MSPLDTDALARYLAGESPADERARISEYLRAHPADAAVVERLRTRPLHASHVLDDYTAERVWQRIGETLDTDLAGATGAATRRKSGTAIRVEHRERTLFGNWGWVAGASAALAAVFVAVSTMRHPAPDAGRIYTTGTGQLATLTLDDGTRVTLAPRTTLRVDTSGATRNVTLDGEAYFNVSHSGGTPFMVHSGTVTTRVLGTTFFVHHYAGDSTVRVAVTSGKVQVAPDGRPERSLLVTTGEAAIATDSQVVRDTDVVQYTEWTDGQLVFRRKPASDVLATLSRWYGYEFRLADPSLARELLTVSISTHSSSEALSTLKLYLGVNLRFDNNVITLSRRAGHAPVAEPSQRQKEVFSQPREVGR